MKISEMRKILKEFSTYKKVTIKNILYFDFQKYIEEKYPNLDNKKLNFFFLNEKNRLEERDKKYEDTRVRKTISFTKSEYEEITKNLDLTTLDFSNFAKAILLNKKIVPKFEKDLIYEINKIGNNLNQIAKAINSRDDKIKILTQLVEIEKAIKSLK